MVDRQFLGAGLNMSWTPPKWAVQAFSKGYLLWPIGLLTVWSEVAQAHEFDADFGEFNNIYLSAMEGEEEAQQIIDEATAKLVARRMMK